MGCGKRPARRVPSFYNSPAFPPADLHSVLKGSKLQAVRVWAATARLPLLSLLAISLEASLVSKTQSREDPDDRVGGNIRVNWTRSWLSEGAAGVGRLHRDAALQAQLGDCRLQYLPLGTPRPKPGPCGLSSVLRVVAPGVR